jgi:hypothetical protein
MAMKPVTRLEMKAAGRASLKLQMVSNTAL